MPAAEKEARSQGWVPQEEFKGSTDDWVDAEKFVERGEKIAAIATKKSKGMSEELESLKLEMKEQKKTFGEFKEFQDESRQRDKETLETWYKNELDLVKNAKRDAINDGNADRVIELDDHKDNVRDRYKEEKDKIKDREKDTGDDVVIDDKVFKEWQKDNNWYADNEDLRIYAEGYGATIKGKYVGKEFLNKISERVKEKFPEDFENPNRDKNNSVEGAGGGRRKQGKTYDDLPPFAKAACDKFCKTIPGFTKDQYLKDVDWEELEKDDD